MLPAMLSLGDALQAARVAALLLIVLLSVLLSVLLLLYVAAGWHLGNMQATSPCSSCVHCIGAAVCTAAHTVALPNRSTHLQAHPPTEAELAGIAGSGQDVDLQEAYGKGEPGSSEEDEEEEGGEEAAAAAGDQSTGAAAADASQQQEQQAAEGKQGRRRRGGGGPHAAQFGAAEIERRRGLWEQRIGRPEMQVCICEGRLFAFFVLPPLRAVLIIVQHAKERHAWRAAVPSRAHIHLPAATTYVRLQSLIAGREALPIAAYREQIVQALDSHQVGISAVCSRNRRFCAVAGRGAAAIGSGGGRRSLMLANWAKLGPLLLACADRLGACPPGFASAAVTCSLCCPALLLAPAQVVLIAGETGCGKTTQVSRVCSGPVQCASTVQADSLHCAS